MNKQAVITTAKEVARIAYLGAISAVLSYAATQLTSLPPDSLYAIVGTVVLKAADKYIHTNPDIPAKGISLI